MEDNEYELLSSEPDQLPTYSVVPEDKIFQFKVVRGEMENKFKLKLKTGQTLPHTSNAKCKGIVNKLISSGPALAKNTSLCPSTATSAGGAAPAGDAVLAAGDGQPHRAPPPPRQGVVQVDVELRSVILSATVTELE